ncbi:MAG: twin-arginine translocase TatA/TatE family subunit [Desulfomonile tiedjei]|nr:twin-arginine translocase TatA/TatE family subunit [Desulfomonile tiedjei]
MLGAQELIVILLIVVIVFGAKRIPEIMEGLGKGIRTFKKVMDGDVEAAIPAQQPGPASPPTPVPPDRSSAAVVSSEKIEPK